MLPYKYKIGNIEARNYVLENYEIKKLGCVELIWHKNGIEFPIGTWRVGEKSVGLEITSNNHDFGDKDRWAMDEVCKTTQKRMENEYCGSLA
ncbi:hypothetical protein EBT16_00035 [bacterium]|nr:hypothetical protein [bacterium]